MEIKITCACGQDFKFEVEPVNGVMPCVINCPACGADDTQMANEMLAQSSEPVSATGASPPGSLLPNPARLRVNRPVATAPSAPENQEPAEPTAAPPKRFYTRSLEPDKPPPPSTENIPRGILGGIIAGAIGMVGWYLLTIATDHEFGMVAWFVGIMTGFGVRILGRDGTALLGAIASICAMLAILGGQFLVVNSQVNQELRQYSQKAYMRQIDAAKEAVSAKTEDDIRSWIAKYQPSESNVSNGDLENFRQSIQPNLQSFLDSKSSREQFDKIYKAHIDSFSLRYQIFKDTISFFTILWVCFGIVSAYKIGSA